MYIFKSHHWDQIRVWNSRQFSARKIHIKHEMMQAHLVGSKSSYFNVPFQTKPQKHLMICFQGFLIRRFFGCYKKAHWRASTLQQQIIICIKNWISIKLRKGSCVQSKEERHGIFSVSTVTTEIKLVFSCHPEKRFGEGQISCNRYLKLHL